MRGEFGHGGRHCSPTCPSEGHSITLDSMDFGMAQPPGGERTRTAGPVRLSALPRGSQPRSCNPFDVANSSGLLAAHNTSRILSYVRMTTLMFSYDPALSARLNDSANCLLPVSPLVVSKQGLHGPTFDLKVEVLSVSRGLSD